MVSLSSERERERENKGENCKRDPESESSQEERCAATWTGSSVRVQQQSQHKGGIWTF